MSEIIGVRFQSAGKTYYFAPGGKQLKPGDYAVVETARSLECGEVVIGNQEVPDEEIVTPLKPVIRKATPEDLQTLERMRQREAEALCFCEKRIAERNLDMHLVSAECAFDNSKLLFYFTADERIDFRDLVKDLAAAFHTRIELRQIGVRDEARMLGGLGICGREFCCKGYLNEFQPVSIKMAKEQGLSLNPAKISGTCGRLMCCLKYEQEGYEYLAKITPRVGAIVQFHTETDGAEKLGVVEDVNLISGQLRVRPEDSDLPVTMNKTAVQVLKNGNGRVKRDPFPKPDAAEQKPQAPQGGQHAGQKEPSEQPKPAARPRQGAQKPSKKQAHSSGTPKKPQQRRYPRNPNRKPREAATQPDQE